MKNRIQFSGKRSPRFNAAVARMIEALNFKEPVEVHFRLTGDREIRALNCDFRGMDRPTNVLSFPVNERWDGALYLGDVVISVPRANAEAKEFGYEPRAYLARLALHGLLHLLGFDHGTAKEMRRMESRERAILKKVGIDPRVVMP